MNPRRLLYVSMCMQIIIVSICRAGGRADLSGFTIFSRVVIEKLEDKLLPPRNWFRLTEKERASQYFPIFLHEPGHYFIYLFSFVSIGGKFFVACTDKSSRSISF